MEFAGTFAFQQRYQSSKIFQVEGVVSSRRIVTVPYDRAMQTLLVGWRNACELAQSAVAWNIALQLRHSTAKALHDSVEWA